MTSLVSAGLTILEVLAGDGSTQAPAMKFLKVFIGDGARRGLSARSAVTSAE